ncbi:hypothetical protein GUJ93_ZPchr0010g8379 [Zizania palustris]|uniref:Uncharacterized protein n=1 Tax=Zizania palustris TaxID=103762 RepID=A0A8J6BHT8_ZIZPA|nr:hypothetical protein GUJ93_ZPchr0010g8379 [Zizania palustris]
MPKWGLGILVRRGHRRWLRCSIVKRSPGGQTDGGYPIRPTAGVRSDRGFGTVEFGAEQFTAEGSRRRGLRCDGEGCSGAEWFTTKRFSPKGLRCDGEEYSGSLVDEYQ